MGLSLSSLGLGTYLGEEDEATDRGYEASIAVALAAGVNVFDSAVNYRGQKSERAVGRALAAAIAGGAARRDEVFVSTKGGYFPHDADDPREPRRYMRETFLDPGLAPPSEIAQGCHCIAPSYLADQLERSRANLGLASIDLYYLHNIETQRGAVDRKTFRARLAAAAAFLEEAAGSGKIAAWGLATWDGLRAPPEHPEHLSLSETLAIAREVGGQAHHFRAVQLPFNLGMAQGLLYRSQETADGRRPALAAAAGMGLAVFGSASLLQGR
ncbi:MAG TPA: aldo/keto reductase, partial [Thermoanaerobaculia bacterium]|nr:aldo/keto reductase [Thermoanaerobaculia bacterium]